MRDEGKARFEYATDTEVVDALKLTMQMEGIIPALESSHAFAGAFKEAGNMSKDDIIIINQSGRGDKDIFTVADAIGDPKWKEFICAKAGEYQND
jgi:tryptophan synthase beta chain